MPYQDGVLKVNSSGATLSPYSCSHSMCLGI